MQCSTADIAVLAADARILRVSAARLLAADASPARWALRIRPAVGLAARWSLSPNAFNVGCVRADDVPALSHTVPRSRDHLFVTA